MNINISLHWNFSDPRWEVYNKTKLYAMHTALPSKAVCLYKLFVNSESKLCIIPPQTEENHIHESCGIIGFTTESLRELLKVNKVSREIRESRETLNIINNYILSLQ